MIYLYIYFEKVYFIFNDVYIHVSIHGYVQADFNEFFYFPITMSS